MVDKHRGLFITLVLLRFLTIYSWESIPTYFLSVRFVAFCKIRVLVEAWNLEFLWNLEFGIWNFPHKPSLPHSKFKVQSSRFDGSRFDVRCSMFRDFSL